MEINRFTIVATTAIIRAARMVVQKKLSMVTWTGRKEVAQTVNDSIAALITRVNNPNVRHVIGSDKNLTIGRTTPLMSPKTTETISRATIDSPVSGVPVSEVSSMPGRIQRATQKDAAVTIVRRI